jgi:hypothetical protein
MDEHEGGDVGPEALQPGDALTLTISSPQHGVSSGPARVVTADATTLVLDLVDARYLHARCERGAPSQLLLLRGDQLRLALTRMIGRPPGSTPRCSLQLPRAWTTRMRDPRARFEAAVEGTVVDGTDDRAFEGEAVDISEGGMRFLSNSPPTAGSIVALRLPVPGGGAMATVQAVIIEAEPPHLGGPPHYVVRCRFTAIGPMVRHLIATFVAGESLLTGSAR